MSFDPQYYSSHQKLSFIGKEGQQKLQQSKVLVIGAGGLGCPCLQYLAGCGIGTIGIADFDTVSISNIHRQVLYNVQDVGKSKVKVVKEKLAAYNPSIKIETHSIKVDQSNVLELLQPYNVIIDCTDNFLVRYLINDASVFLDKPLVYGAIHQTEGHVTVFNYNQSPTLRCLFAESDTNDIVQSCADIGAYNIITGIIGLMMANEVVKIIVKHDEVFAGILLNFDALTGKTRQIKYNGVANSRKISNDRFEEPTLDLEISADTLQQKIVNNEAYLLIDVREVEERALFNIGGEHIPLQGFLKNGFTDISPDTAVVIYCQHGIRSLKAAINMRKKGFSKAVSLHGGMHLWQYHLLNNK